MRLGRLSVFVVLMVAGVLLCSGLLPYSPAQGQTSASTTTETCSAPGSPPGSGAACGGFTVFAASLAVGGSGAILDFSIQDTGNMNVGGATVYLNGTMIGPGNITLDLQPGPVEVVTLTHPHQHDSHPGGEDVPTGPR